MSAKSHLVQRQGPLSAGTIGSSGKELRDERERSSNVAAEATSLREQLDQVGKELRDQHEKSSSLAAEASSLREQLNQEVPATAPLGHHQPRIAG